MWKNIFKYRYLLLGFASGFIGGLTAMWLMGFWLGDNITNNINNHQNLTLKEDSVLIDAVAKVTPSVVNIISNKNIQSIFGKVFEQIGGGTGFIVRDNGFIATNRHVVADEKAKFHLMIWQLLR